MVGYIYKCTCNINQKVYIGQTINTPIKRWRSHLWSASHRKAKDYDTHFHKAIRKYGEKAFVWEILETVSCNTKKELCAELNKLERYYISEYNSFKRGYNMTDGGQNANNKIKEITMFDSSGTLLRNFESSTKISEEFDIELERISNNCNRRTSFVLINGVRYIFRYKGDIVSLSDLQKVKSIKSDPKMAVIAIDSITKEVLKEFKTQAEAARYFGIISHNISEVINGKRKSAGKYNGNPIYWVKKPLI